LTCMVHGPLQLPVTLTLPVAGSTLTLTVTLFEAGVDAPDGVAAAVPFA